jgi:Rrf2 family protein
MISQTAEYALRTIVWLATQQDRPQTTQTIAAATGVPPSYLSKILQTLGRAGLVRSQRGLHGGFTLAADPDELSTLEVIQAVDPIRRFESCPLGLESHGEELCPLHRRLDDAIGQVEKVFAESRISELVAEGASEGPLCG